MNKDFFRNMKMQMRPDDETIEDLKNKMENKAKVKCFPLWLGGICAAGICCVLTAGLFLSDGGNDIIRKESSVTAKVNNNAAMGGHYSVGAEVSEENEQEGTKENEQKETVTSAAQQGNVSNIENGPSIEFIPKIQIPIRKNEVTDIGTNESEGGEYDDKTDDKAGIDTLYPEITVTDEGKFTMTLSGSAFSFPADCKEVIDLSQWCDLVENWDLEYTPEKVMVESGDTASFLEFKDGVSISGSMSVRNYSTETKAASDCSVESLFLTDCKSFSVGGIKSGVTYQDVNEVFGTNCTADTQTLTVSTGGAIFSDSIGSYTLTAVIGFDGTGTVDYVGESKVYENLS